MAKAIDDGVQGEVYMERLFTLYDSADVKRLHTVPTRAVQTVGQHTHGTMLFAAELICHARNAGHTINAEWVLMELLTHDAPELVTGDIPAPVKRRSEGLVQTLAVMEVNFYADLHIESEELSELERGIVKASDILDLMMFCIRERQMGNHHPRIGVVMANVHSYLDAQLCVPGVAGMREHLWSVWAALGE